MLVVFAGLPGIGKTTLARLLAARDRAACLHVGAIEAGLRRTGQTAESIGAAGYEIAAEDRHQMSGGRHPGGH